MTHPLRLGIFGWPVAHSKSPAMHESAARALGIALRYESFAVPASELADAVRTQHDAAIDGYNVTVPHKQAVIPLLDEVVPTARVVGAVNTVARIDGRYVGHNTDAPGLVRSLREAGVDVRGASVVIVGAGGAARAGVVGLAGAGAARITVLSRRPEQATDLVNEVGPHAPSPLRASGLDEAPRFFSSATLLVQATSATLGSTPAAHAFAASLPIESLPPDAAVVDMVYQPLETTVLARARQRDLQVVDGLGMLLHQGANAFELWTGRKAPLPAMREALSPVSSIT